MKLKLAFILVLLIAILEAGWIYLSSDLTKSINLPSYSFTDSGGGLVTAKGSWISSTELAFPLQTVEIDCWKEFNYCWIADATLMDNSFISVGMNLEEIAEWNNDYITTKPSASTAGCVEETWRFDRRSKVVTYTRNTLNTTGLCEGISKEPIVSKLGDGLERLGLKK